MTSTARILVVEDEAIVAMDIQERLETAGYTVVAVVDSGEEAVAAADGLRPDLVLMDIHLKGAADGIAAAEEIRARCRLPVIYLTAFADDPTVRRARATEAFGYLLKPFRERELHTAIQMALARADVERRLRRSERRYAATVNSIGDGIVAVDGGGRVTLLNPVAERLTGWSQDEARGQPVENVLVLVHEHTRAGVENPATRALRDNDVANLPDQTLLLARDGRAIPIEDCAAPIRDEDSAAPDGAVLAFRDVTEQKRSEARLRQAQKLESLGVLSGGIAHDFNNLLTPILGYATLAGEVVPPESPALPMLRQIEKAARRAGELSAQMLAYAGKTRLVREAVDLSALVREMAELLAPAVSKKASLRLALAPGLPAVEADPAQLRQVVMNLITNASEALEDRPGTILLRTRRVDADRAALQSPYGEADLPEGPYVLLEVVDTGCGMTAETLANLFDPFFTTKFQGRGLGLAAVLGIARGHKGVIKVDSRLGHGSTFQLLLPCTERVPAAAPAPAQSGGWRGAGTVLVAEDEPGIRTLARQFLEGAGFTVVLADDGQKALDTFLARPGEFVLALLDLTMPRLNGREVLDELRRARPDLPVVFMSGYSEEEVGRLVGTAPRVAVVQKPFFPSTLLAKVRQMLDSAP